MKKSILLSSAVLFAFASAAAAQEHREHGDAASPHSIPPRSAAPHPTGAAHPDHGTAPHAVTPAPHAVTPQAVPTVNAMRGPGNQNNAMRGPNHRPNNAMRGPGRPSNSPDFNSYRRNFNAPHRFHAPAYRRPTNWYAHHWVFGERLPPAFFVRDYWIADYSAFDLEPPPYGTVWVRVEGDALLIDQETGEVIQVEYDAFY